MFSYLSLKTGFHHVAQAGLKLAVLLLPPAKPVGAQNHGQFTRYWPCTHQVGALPTEAHLQVLHVALILLELADDRKHRQKAVIAQRRMVDTQAGTGERNSHWLERAAASLMLPGLVFYPIYPHLYCSGLTGWFPSLIPKIPKLPQQTIPTHFKGGNRGHTHTA